MEVHWPFAAVGLAAGLVTLIPGLCTVGASAESLALIGFVSLALSLLMLWLPSLANRAASGLCPSHHNRRRRSAIGGRAAGDLISSEQLEARLLLSGRTITVGSTDAPTLQAADDIAEPGDTIMVPNGTWSGARLFTDRTTIIGNGIGSTVLDGANNGPVLEIHGTGIRVSKLTITNGLGAGKHGGGIQLRNGTAEIVDVEISQNNSTQAGGGISVIGPQARLTLRNSLVQDNTTGRGITNGSAGFGSAIFVADGGALVAEGNMFKRNDAWLSGVIYAGAVDRFDLRTEPSGRITLIGNTFQNNTADNEGGVVVRLHNDSLLFANNLLVNNNGNALTVSGNAPARILNNTIHGQSGSFRQSGNGISAASATNAWIFSNAVTSNLGTGVDAADAKLLDFNFVSNNGIEYSPTTTAGAHSGAGDPLYTDPDNGDFTPLPGSPLLQTGTTEAAYANPDGSRNTIGFGGGPWFNNREASFSQLPQESMQQLESYAKATMRLFLDPRAVNTAAGVPHTTYQTGAFRRLVDGVWQEAPQDIERGYGSHFVPNEATLMWKDLALAYKADWLTDVPAAQKYDASWGFIQKGIETFKLIVNSLDTKKFKDGMLYRAYKTTPGVGDSDPNRDLLPEQITRADDQQSSDDNLLFIEGLFSIWGLVIDPTVAIPQLKRNEIVGLIRGILKKLDCQQFFWGNQIIFNLTDGLPSRKSNGELATWDRLTAEGPILLANAILHVEGGNTMPIQEFESVMPSFQTNAINYQSHSSGDILVPLPAYNGQSFVTGLRNIHSIPTTPSEGIGATFFANSTRPTFEAGLDFADSNGFSTLFDHVMNNTLNGILLNSAADSTNPQTQREGVLPANESNSTPVPGRTMPRVTTSSSFFTALARSEHLAATEVLHVLDETRKYEARFFDGEVGGFGWQTAIPYRPDDVNVGWVSERDNELKYSDFGNFYSTIHNSYLLENIYDALHPDELLTSLNVHKERLAHIAARLDSNIPLPADLFAAPGIILEPVSPEAALTEGNGSLSYRIRLASKPTASVSVNIATDIQTTAATASVTLSPTQWQTGVVVQLTAVDDAAIEGNHASSISLESSSNDPWYFERLVSATIGVIDNEIIPSPPTILSPISRIQTQRPMFAWTRISQASSYELLVQRPDNANETVLLTATAETSYLPLIDLKIGRYQASVRTRFSSGVTTQWSSLSFQIDTRVLLVPIAALQLTARPALQWQSLYGAARYDLWLNNRTTGQNQFIRDDSIETTSWTPTTDLPIGSYRVWVRAIDATDVAGGWSLGLDFVISPRVNLALMAKLQPTSRPPVSWAALAGASKYDIWIDNRTTNEVQYIRNQNITTTSFTPAANLPIAVYRTWVRAIDAKGVPAQWSVATDFTVATAPLITTPLNSTFNRKPPFSWNAVTGALKYAVQLRNLTTGVTVYNATNITTTNWTSPVNLPDGQYRWWVVAFGAGSVQGLWTAPVDFNVGGQATLLTPTRSTTNAKPVFSWKPVDGAARYELWVNNATTTASVVKQMNLTSLTYTPATTLPKGNYRAWVRAISTTGEVGVWSLEVKFTIAAQEIAPQIQDFLSPLSDELLVVLRSENNRPQLRKEKRSTTNIPLQDETEGDKERVEVSLINMADPKMSPPPSRETAHSLIDLVMASVDTNCLLDE